MDKLISFNLAFKSKLLGYNRKTQNRYFKDGTLNGNNKIRYGEPVDYNNECFQDETRKYSSAPTNAELATYLLEEYGLSIEVFYTGGKWHFEIWDIRNNQRFTDKETVSEESETKDEAIYKAFILALNKLIN